MNDSRSNQSLLILLLIAGLCALAVTILWKSRQGTPPPVVEDIPLAVAPVAAEPIPEPQPIPEPEPVPPVVQVPAAPTAPPPPPLPTLDKSDAEIRAALLTGSQGGARFWLIEEHLLRKFVRLVNAVEEGRLVGEYRPFLNPTTPFGVRPQGDQWQLDTQNYSRYTPYINSLEQIGSERLIRLYKHYLPLLEEAQKELGVDKGSFVAVTRRALTRLAQAQSPDAAVPLDRPSVMYRFADSDLERGSALDKLLFRLGPANSAKLKALIQQLQQQL